MVIYCSLCSTHDFKHRYVSMIDALGRPSQLCATCFKEWQQQKKESRFKGTTNKLHGGKL